MYNLQYMAYSAEKTLPVGWLDGKTPSNIMPRAGFEPPTSRTTDNATTMVGHISGVQKRILDINPKQSLCHITITYLILLVYMQLVLEQYL